MTRPWGKRVGATALTAASLLMTVVPGHASESLPGLQSAVATSVNLTSRPSLFYTGVLVFLGLFLLGGAASATYWFVKVFTTDLKPGAEGLKDRDTLVSVRKMILFCYIFTSLSLVIAALPLAFSMLPVEFTRGMYSVMVESPVSLVLGCVHDTRPEDSHWEVVCRDDDRYSDQWLINIGGYALASPPPWLLSGAAPDVVQGATAPAAGQDTAAVDRQLRALTYFLPRIIIHGGVTVPFYFVLVSLLGATVSMTRRVPEYQKRLLDQEDPMWPPEARERLVFQILQFVSAPFIAITAYALITPASPTTSIALAFVSGFSSESILLAITAVANQIEATVFPKPPPLAKERTAPAAVADPAQPGGASGH